MSKRITVVLPDDAYAEYKNLSVVTRFPVATLCAARLTYNLSKLVEVREQIANPNITFPADVSATEYLVGLIRSAGFTVSSNA